MINDGSTTYSDDANGNRTMSGYQTGTGNRLESDGVWSYTHDGAGSLLRKCKGANQETWDYGYDHKNQLIWAERRGEVGGTVLLRADYKYDAFGNRIEKAVDADGAGAGGTTTTRFALEGWRPRAVAPVGNEYWDTWADLSGSNQLQTQLQTRYLRGDVVDQLFARIASGGTAAWYLADRLGSIRNLVDSGGGLIATLVYDGFGNLVSAEDPDADRMRWTGREWDSEKNSYHHRRREYGPDIGRFWMREPAWPKVGDPTNLYRYGLNSPLNATDPSGFQEQREPLSFPHFRPPVLPWLPRGDLDDYAEEQFLKLAKGIYDQRWNTFFDRPREAQFSFGRLTTTFTVEGPATSNWRGEIQPVWTREFRLFGDDLDDKKAIPVKLVVTGMASSDLSCGQSIQFAMPRVHNVVTGALIHADATLRDRAPFDNILFEANFAYKDDKGQKTALLKSHQGHKRIMRLRVSSRKKISRVWAGERWARRAEPNSRLCWLKWLSICQRW
jgi:RHS repeat-associated protein